MDMETSKAINNVSKRLTEVERKLERFLLERQGVTNTGLADIGDIVNTHEEAILDLAETVGGLAQGPETG